jgi:hypothetical protein
MVTSLGLLGDVRKCDMGALSPFLKSTSYPKSKKAPRGALLLTVSDNQE